MCVRFKEQTYHPMPAASRSSEETCGRMPLLGVALGRHFLGAGCDPGVSVLQLLMCLGKLCCSSVEVGVESSGDSSKDVDAVFSSFSQRYSCVLSTTDSARKVSIDGGAQLLAVSEVEG